MPIARRNPKELKPYANNPKTHPPEQIAKIIALIDRFGFPDGKAIILDENDEIIHGHGRCLAAIEMDLETVPVETIANLSEADKRAWRIADNAVAESEWDWGKLEIETCELQKLGSDLKLTGLSEASLGKLQGLPDKSAEFRHFNDDPPDPTDEGKTATVTVDRGLLFRTIPISNTTVQINNFFCCFFCFVVAHC
ncbi:MAG: ParB N-terminal domain-containing protein [Cyanobacteria bacterium SBLK]|nr:ParB N-terminal domain-containing protein [Cyanobacteria bacterium SBLK]